MAYIQVDTLQPLQSIPSTTNKPKSNLMPMPMPMPMPNLGLGSRLRTFPLAFNANAMQPAKAPQTHLSRTREPSPYFHTHPSSLPSNSTSAPRSLSSAPFLQPHRKTRTSPQPLIRQARLRPIPLPLHPRLAQRTPPLRHHIPPQYRLPAFKQSPPSGRSRRRTIPPSTERWGVCDAIRRGASVARPRTRGGTGAAKAMFEEEGRSLGCGVARSLR